MISLDPGVASAIRERPDDDEPRLAAAAQMPPDRGELVRVQIALARDPGNRELIARQGEILTANEEAWTGSWRHAASKWEWSRGFVESVEIRPSLVLSDSLASLGVSEPALRSLTFAVAQQDSGWDEIEAVIASGILAGVRTVRIQDMIVPRPGSPAFLPPPRTQSADRIVRAIARAPDWPLLELEVQGGVLAAASLRALGESPRDATLSRLALLGCGVPRQGFAAIAERGTALEDLDLSRNGITDASGLPPPGDVLHMVTHGSGLERVSKLALSRCILGAAQARELARSRRLPALTELFLQGNAIYDAGAIEIAAGKRLARLSRLDLSSNQIRDDGADALAKSPHLAGLSQLVLTGNHISHAGQQRLRDRFGDRVRLDQQSAIRR